MKFLFKVLKFSDYSIDWLIKVLDQCKTKQKAYFFWLWFNHGNDFANNKIACKIM